MKRHLLALFLGIAASVPLSAARADVSVSNATLSIMAQDQEGGASQAQAIALKTGTVPTGVCLDTNGNPINRYYIEYADKQLYAAALTAVTTNQTVTIRIKTSAPTRYIDPYGSTACRVLSITW
jgi:hypothetical protein